MAENNAVFDELEEILSAEHTALVSGDLDGLARLLPRKAAHLETLNGANLPTKARAMRLQSAARHNARLYESALGGMRLVLARMSDLRAPSRDFTTYASDGQATRLPGVQERSVEHKA